MLGRFFLVIGGLVVVALFVALLAPFFVDWTSFRLGFEQQASRILGKKVTVHGGVDARILPFPSVTMRDVRVGRDTDGSPQVQVAEFSMDMELAPFLSGEARIFDMRIVKPKARIRLLKDGKLDWMRGSRAEIPARNVVLEDVHITDAQIEFIDEETGRNRTLSNLTADLSAHSLAGPWRAEGNGTLDGYEAAFSLSSAEPDAKTGEVPLKLKLRPDFQPVELQLDGALGIAESRPQLKGDFNLAFLEPPVANGVVAPAATAPAPRTKGKFELTNDRIRISEYRVEAGALDNPYVVTGEATLDTGEKPEFLLTADGQQVDVAKLTAELVPKGKTSRDLHLSAQRRLNALIDMAARIPVPQVPGRATISLPAIVTEGTTVRDVHLDVKPSGNGWNVENAVATLPGRTRVEADGKLVLSGEPSFAGRMLLASNQPSGLADWLTGKVDPAIRKLKAAGFSANVDLTRAAQNFDKLELAIGPATLKGRVERKSATDAKTAPDLAIDLAGDEIDLDALRALASLVTGQDAGKDVLDHELTAHLKADRLMAFGVAANGVEAQLELGESGLSVEQLSIADLAGAKVMARGNAQGSVLDYRGSGSVNLSVADAQPFLAMLRENLPRHPVLERLARNAEFFADTNLVADITLGDDAVVQVTGLSNGTKVEGRASAHNLFDLTQETGYAADVALTNPQSAALFGQVGLSILPLDGEDQAALNLSLKGQGGAPAQVKLGYTSSGSQLDAEGTLGLNAEDFGSGSLQFNLKSQDVEPNLMVLSVGLPDFGSGLPLEAKGKLSVTPERLQLADLSGNVAGNPVAGEISIDRRAQRPTASGQLSLGTLDLTWLAEAVYGPLSSAQDGALSNAAFAKPIFGQSDVSLQVSADKVRLPNGWPDAEGLTARLVNRADGLTLEDVKAGWLGGHLGGRLALSNSDGIGLLQTRLSLEGGQLAPLMWQRNGHAVADGSLGFEFAAEATAKTPLDLVKAANGSGTLHLRKVALPDLAQNPMADLLARADKIEGEVTEAKVRPLVEQVLFASGSRIEAVDIPFTLASGQLRIQNIAANSGATQFTGDAQFDLQTQAVEAALTVSYDVGEEAMAGGDAEASVRFSGDWSAPERAIDVAAMSNFLSLRAFERERRRVETLQASVLEKQRLRREASLYQYRAAERQKAQEKAAAEAAAREQEAARQRASEAQRQKEQQQKPDTAPALTLPPLGQKLQMDNLPGVMGN